MSTDEQAREQIAQQRLHEEHIKKTMLNRAESEINNLDHQNSTVEEQARETLSKERHHQEHLQETMLKRAESENNS